MAKTHFIPLTLRTEQPDGQKRTLFVNPDNIDWMEQHDDCTGVHLGLAGWRISETVGEILQLMERESG